MTYADVMIPELYFTIADGALWGTYVGTNIYGNWQKDRYIAYAQTNGGAKSMGKMKIITNNW